MAKRTSIGMNRMGRMNFEKLIENSGVTAREFKAQTANGTAHTFGTGWNKEWDWEMDQVEPAPAWNPGRSNRTGE